MGFLFYLFQLFLNGMRLRPATQLLARWLGAFAAADLCSWLFCEVLFAKHS